MMRNQRICKCIVLNCMINKMFILLHIFRVTKCLLILVNIYIYVCVCVCVCH